MLESIWLHYCQMLQDSSIHKVACFPLSSSCCHIIICLHNSLHCICNSVFRHSSPSRLFILSILLVPVNKMNSKYVVLSLILMALKGFQLKLQLNTNSSPLTCLKTLRNYCCSYSRQH